MARILIAGGTGFVGSNLARYFGERYEVITASRHRQENAEHEWLCLDITKPQTTVELVCRLAPNVVINVAGIKDVRFCEHNPLYAFRVNGQGTGNLASACRKVGSKLIYVSSDLVFPSSRGWYTEIDIPCSPLVYGQSKLLGEYRAMRALDNLAICRSGGVYGKGSPLLRWAAEEITAGRPLECFTDVFNTPTYAYNLAAMIAEIIDRDLSGIFHTVGTERVHRLDFFSGFARTFGLDCSLLQPALIASRRSSMLLMPDSSLSSVITAGVLNTRGTPLDEGFRMLREDTGY